MPLPKRIICVGHTAYDRVYQLPKVVAPPAKTPATGYFEIGGGMAGNGAVAVAHLGAQSVFWGAAGEDSIADAMAADFARHGVDATYMRRSAGHTSSHSAILVQADGERLIVNVRGSALEDAGDWLPLADLARADALLADVRWVPGCLKALAAARAAGVPTVLDGDVGERGAMRALVAHTDYAVFSEPGLACFHEEGRAGGDTRAALQAALDLGARVAVATRGERGCEWMRAESPGELRHTPAFAVKAVDTTGAGDSFHGAFALMVAEGKPLEQALRFAAAAAAVKVQRMGARSMPSRTEVEAIMAQQGTM
jgi:sulfofructose kinase